MDRTTGSDGTSGQEPRALLHALANDLHGLLLDLELHAGQLPDDDPRRAEVERWAAQARTASARTRALWDALRDERADGGTPHP